jgi:hypothetical protein
MAPDQQEGVPRHSWRFRPAGLLRRLLAKRHLAAAPVFGAWQGDLDAIRETRALVPLLVNDAAALQLIAAVRSATRLGGAMAEAGVFMGGTARLICFAKGAAPLHLFDVFETAQDGKPADRAEQAVCAHFGELHGREADVAELLSLFPAVHRHPGFFPTTACAIDAERFSFVHLDLDLPESTRAGLDIFMPRMVGGGILIGDDYEDTDLRTLFRAYFEGRPDTYVELPWGQVMIVKQAERRQGATVSVPRIATW